MNNYKLITNEPTEQISISYEDTEFAKRFMLVKWMPTKVAVTIILNPREAREVAEFIDKADKI